VAFGSPSSTKVACSHARPEESNSKCSYFVHQDTLESACPKAARFLGDHGAITIVPIPPQRANDVLPKKSPSPATPGHRCYLISQTPRNPYGLLHRLSGFWRRRYCRFRPLWHILSHNRAQSRLSIFLSARLLSTRLKLAAQQISVPCPPTSRHIPGSYKSSASCNNCFIHQTPVSTLSHCPARCHRGYCTVYLQSPETTSNLYLHDSPKAFPTVHQVEGEPRPRPL